MNFELDPYAELPWVDAWYHLTLPTLAAEAAPELEDIYEAMNLKRLRLKHDQRVPEKPSSIN